MERLRAECVIAVAGVLTLIGSVAAHMFFGAWTWLCAALATVGALAALCAPLLIWRDHLSSLRMLKSAVKNGDASVPDECIFSEDINQFVSGFQNSISLVNLEKAYRDTQLQVLSGQINPHFLYNTLESVRGQVLLSNDYVTADMVEMLSGFFRYCISKSGSIVCLRDEIKNVKSYLAIMEFRFPGKFTFELIGDLSNYYNYEIPKLTLQPIVENAILHGITDFSSGGKISLRSIETDVSLKLYVRDNGVGMSDEQVSALNESLLDSRNVQACPNGAARGYALFNINRRIQLAYGHDYGIRVFSTPHVGTNIMVCLPKIPFESEDL